MEQQIAINPPFTIRAILTLWAMDFESAPGLAGAAGAQAAGALYRRLAAVAPPAMVRRGELARLYDQTRGNAALGQRMKDWNAQDLCDEAAQMLRWLAPLIASDPVLREHCR